VTGRRQSRAAAVVVALAALLLLADAAPRTDEPVLGTPPSYGPGRVGGEPNDGAVVRRIWMPGLDQGWNPQGLTVAQDEILVAAYRSDSREMHRGPCRVFRVDPRSGADIGEFDVPSPCGHAGGLGYAGNGRLYLADTHTLFAIDLAGPRIVRTIPLAPDVVGALAVSAADAVWIGSYRTDGPGRLLLFPRAVLDSLPDGAVLETERAAAELRIPSHAQGAAIDKDGRLWVARSGLRWGELDRLDMKSGAVERAYRAPAGLEGIAFDAEGRLWAVSEAGARHYYAGIWGALLLPFYPLIVAIDPQRLE
jgi:sugar lactone lactonase YvrE